MQSYPANSPQAMARVIAMMMVTDGELHDTEIEFLERNRAFEALGLSRIEFREVARQYCADLIATSAAVDTIRLIDPARIDQIIACITDTKKRKVVCKHALGIIVADGDVGGQEVAVFRYVLTVWDVDPDQFLPERDTSL
jgi:uncharacterized tellurite resistance protein B-like protein